MRDGGTAADADDEPSLFLHHLQQRPLVKIAHVAEFDLDEDDRHVGTESVPLADGFFLADETMASGTVRNENREFHVDQTLPEEARALIPEFKAFKAEFRTPYRARDQGCKQQGQNETECDGEA